MQAQERFASYAPVAAQVGVAERMAFLRKVYGLLSLSLISATVGAVVGVKYLLPFFAGNFIITFVLMIGLLLFAQFAQHKPGLNMVALFSFTTFMGASLAPTLFVYSAFIPQALALTAFTFIGLTSYVFISKKDFSFMGGFLITGLFVMIGAGLLNIFLQSPILHVALSAAGVLLFSGFILYDTSNIIRRYPTDQYVSAALALFLDVILLFQHILAMFGIMGDD